MSGDDEAETTAELEQQAQDHQQEEALAGALQEINEEMGAADPIETDAYQDREERRRQKFNELHGLDDEAAAETEEYLEDHHAHEAGESDGQSNT